MTSGWFSCGRDRICEQRYNPGIVFAKKHEKRFCIREGFFCIPQMGLYSRHAFLRQPSNLEFHEQFAKNYIKKVSMFSHLFAIVTVHTSTTGTLDTKRHI